MSKKRPKLQEAVRGRYTPIPHELLDSRKFIGLSHIAKALLFDALRQHNGRNNGHIQLSEKWLKGRGWVSGETIQRARRELVSAGLLSVTHAGGLNRGATLYGFTWLDITDCKGLDITAGQFVKGDWRDPSAPLVTCKTGASIADAPASENYKEHTDHRCSTAPTIGVANSLTTPTIGVRKGVFDHSTTPTIGDNETVASYPTFSGTSGADGFKGLGGGKQGEKEAKGASAIFSPDAATTKPSSTGLEAQEDTRADFELWSIAPDVTLEALADDVLPADEPKKRGRPRAQEAESLPLPF